MQEPMEKWIEQLLNMNDEEKMTEKQIKIIQAAIETFSEKGYAASSTSEIAQKAGVAEGTIFRHYKTKKDLLISIVAPMMVKIMAPLLAKEFAKIIKAPYESFEDFLRAVIRNRFDFVRSNLPMVKILIQEIPFHDDLRQLFKEIFSKHVLEHLMRAVEHFQKEGAILDAPPRSVIRFIVSGGFGLVLTLLLFLPELDWDEEEEIEGTIHMLMNGLKP